MTKAERFEGCIMGGAIGDAFGSGYENQNTFKEEGDDDIFYLFGKPKKKEPDWQITDDTQLTLATIEAMIEDEEVKPKTIAHYFLKLFRRRELRGVGASTLKALRELDFGAHWSQVGRKGEFAAGNGAAMRIAPIAFKETLSKSKIRDICSITHQNDEAYIGAMCVVIAIREVLNGNWSGDENLLELIIPQIPDTKVRDRLIEIKDIENLGIIGGLGSRGYVVHSVPLAIAAANQVKQIGMERMFLQLIKIGGDTDTNCSIAGQVAGTLLGQKGIPQPLKQKLSKLNEYEWIRVTVSELIKEEGWVI